MKVLLIVLSLMFITPNVWAKSACREDFNKFCKDTEKGMGRKVHCLLKNWDQLSEKCKAKKQKKYDRWSKRLAACGGDIEKLCKGADVEKGGVKRCLKANKDKLSESCKTYKKEREAHRKSKQKDQRG